MAIVKASYTKSSTAAKAGVRYIEHRPGKDKESMNRTLFGNDGLMGRWQAYRMIDEAQEGSIFFRFILSPDPKGEDTEKELHLREVTEHTMLKLEEHVHKQIQWVAAVHDDHAPHRHVHIVAVVPGRLQRQEFAALPQVLREAATLACGEQRRELALMQEKREQEREGEQWERER